MRKIKQFLAILSLFLIMLFNVKAQNYTIQFNTGQVTKFTVDTTHLSSLNGKMYSTLGLFTQLEDLTTEQLWVIINNDKNAVLLFRETDSLGSYWKISGNSTKYSNLYDAYRRKLYKL